MTSAALEPLWAVTGEGLPKVAADAPILACVSITLGVPEHAGFSLPAIDAVTDKVSHQVHAKSAIPTRIWRALVLIDVAMDAFPALFTYTLVAVDAIYAGSPIQARVGFTVIDIFLAVRPHKTEITCTGESAVRFTYTHAVFPAYIGRDELYPARLGMIRLQGNGTTVNHLT